MRLTEVVAAVARVALFAAILGAQKGNPLLAKLQRKFKGAQQLACLRGRFEMATKLEPGNAYPLLFNDDAHTPQFTLCALKFDPSQCAPPLPAAFSVLQFNDIAPAISHAPARLRFCMLNQDIAGAEPRAQG